jgi:hypothetical protein
MSALSPIADIHQRGLHVRLVPQADIEANERRVVLIDIDADFPASP